MVLVKGAGEAVWGRVRYVRVSALGAFHSMGQLGNAGLNACGGHRMDGSMDTATCSCYEKCMTRGVVDVLGCRRIPY